MAKMLKKSFCPYCGELATIEGKCINCYDWFRIRYGEDTHEAYYKTDNKDDQTNKKNVFGFL